MNVHPFPTSAIFVDLEDDVFPDDFHEDFADFDDTDETMRRFGSIDRQYRWAHRTVSAPMFSALTGIQVSVCQAFHAALFGLLEDVGDFDGIIATPGLLIAGRRERVAAATAWLAANPPPDVHRLSEAFDELDDTEVGAAGTFDDLVQAVLSQHSQGLAGATGANPSLTLGSATALADRLIDEILDLVGSCQVDEIERLATVAASVLGMLPGSLRLVGGATIERLADSRLPPLSV